MVSMRDLTDWRLFCLLRAMFFLRRATSSPGKLVGLGGRTSAGTKMKTVIEIMSPIPTITYIAIQRKSCLHQPSNICQIHTNTKDLRGQITILTILEKYLKFQLSPKKSCFNYSAHITDRKTF